MRWELCTCRSTDAGRTWSEPAPMTIRHHFADGIEPVPSGRIIELSDGIWFNGFETWKTYENDGLFDLNSYALFPVIGASTGATRSRSRSAPRRTVHTPTGTPSSWRTGASSSRSGPPNRNCSRFTGCTPRHPPTLPLAPGLDPGPIAYGAPRIIPLDSDQAMASFWCTQGADTHCRWCRVRW